MSRGRFTVGRSYHRRRELHDIFGGQAQGGMSTPKRFPVIFLFTGAGGEAHGYRDGWRDDGSVYQYTGEGQIGDMQFVRSNRALRDHAVDGREVHLFENEGGGRVRYLGEFVLGGYEFHVLPDTELRDRRAIVFDLVPLERSEELADEPDPEDAADTDIEALRASAYGAGSAEQLPGYSDAPRSIYRRSRAVRLYVLARAAGICELCEKGEPFSRGNGSPYLEPHHIHRLSDGGPDLPNAVAALCPNCHREVHHGAHGRAKNDSLAIKIKELEGEL